jgi:type II secretion system protein H
VKTRAFTLTELMIVVAVIGIMAALVIPEMRGTYEDAVLRSTSRKIISALHLASSRAVALQQKHRVRIDLEKHRYHVERTGQEGESTRGFLPVKDIPGCEGDLDARILVRIRSRELPADDADPEMPAVVEEAPQTSPRAEAIGFYPDGTADATEVLLRDRNDFRVLLRVNGTTGRVVVAEPSPE